MYIYNLIDGVSINGELVKTVSMKSLTDIEKGDIADLVDYQYQEIINIPDFKPVNEKHLQSIKGFMLLNEHAAASISLLGQCSVSFTFDDVCKHKITAQDWNVILKETNADYSM